MSSDSSTPQQTTSKSKSKEDDRLLTLKPSTSEAEATIYNQRMFWNLEEVMTYIGARYPYYRTTVLPICIVYFFIYFASRVILETKKMSLNEVAENNGTHEFFYSKCLPNNEDDSLKVAEKADFLHVEIPKGELTIVMNALFMFATTTISPRIMVLVCIGMNSLCYFIMAHFPTQLQMMIYLSQIFTEIYRIVATVTIAESVPKFHRVPALVLIELVRTASRSLSTVFVRLPSEVSLDMTYSLEIFGFLMIFMGFLAYYTFHDSLFSLLARSKTDQMQDRLTHIFDKSDILLAPDTVIDQIAFENFENNTSPIEILTKTLKTFKLIQEVLVCGLISGASLAVNSFAEAEINRHAEVMFFEKTLIPGPTYLISSLLLIMMSFLMPKKRILPVIIVIPVLFLLASAIFMIPAYFKELDKCSQHWVVSSSAFPLFLSVGILTSALTDVIRFLVKLHLLEVMPVLIRVPIISLLFFVQYSFDGNVRDLYATNSIGGETILVLITVLSMLVLLITPRKKNEMNVYFSEYTNNDKERQLPPAPKRID
ncbi:hypothetical protein CRE_22154 [Caenorhabditis remanei]|uniref:Uncharacterized protein n=1 Tax=Caenorhabditis remanei TaxID=31234 RepID=E3NJ05_CAERE|nr:hypothetical protein CRE_22154 [Caenorhabditis remanei]